MVPSVYIAGVGFCSCVFGLGTFEKVFDCPLRQVGKVCFNGNCLKIFVLHWIMCVIGSAICGDFIIDVRQMRIRFLLRKTLFCYLVFWIPLPCLGTGLSGSVFCSCLNFPSIFVCTLLFYVCVFFVWCFHLRLFCSWGFNGGGVD